MECDSVYLHKYLRRGVSTTTATPIPLTLCVRRAKTEGRQEDNHQSRRNNMPGFKTQPPAREHTEFGNHRDAHDGMRKKMVAVAPIEISKAAPRGDGGALRPRKEGRALGQQERQRQFAASRRDEDSWRRKPAGQTLRRES
jgi:hypothetical protein